MKQEIRYEVTGCAAHSRLVPLLPSDWKDSSLLSSTPSDTIPPDFLWENAPRQETRQYRDDVKCYSHLPNGTAVLDDKWALARLLKSQNSTSTASTKLATLETYCFRGITGFKSFCERVDMFAECSQSQESGDTKEYRFPDLQREGDPGNLQIPPCPPNLYVIKDANSNGAGGIWIVGPRNAASIMNPLKTPLLEEHRYVAQRYAWPPVLYDGRKCHVRVYGLLTCDGRAFVHQRAFLHVANELFHHHGNDDEFQDSVHITNCCANSHDETKFAGEICADMDATEYSELDGQTVVPLSDFFPSISASVAELARRAFPFLRGGEANNGFEYLGMDFILSYDSSTNAPVAYMLEVNAPPSQDTATGLCHAEDLHDEVIKDILSLWVIPKVTGNSVEKPGGWKCVYHESNDDDMDKGSYMVPSKAAILNKIRWAIYERKNSRADSEEKDDSEENGGLIAGHGKKNTPASSLHSRKVQLSADAIASFARSQFPYYGNGHCQNPSDSSTTLPPVQIFFENAGGSQVPYQVIREVSSSLSHRNRCVNGKKSKDAARRTLSTILGVQDGMMFLGANASTLFERLGHLYVQSGMLSSEDEVIISTENHLANVTPWLSAAQSVGAEVKWWHLQESTEIESTDKSSHDLRDLLSKRTRVLAVSHASNILGQVRDLGAICRLVKERTDGYGHVVADGVALAPHMSPSVSESMVDWYAVSCHKLFGPHIGALYGCARVVQELYDDTTCDEDRYRLLECGTISYEACAGVVGLGSYFRALATFSEQSWTESKSVQARNQCTESWRDRDENQESMLGEALAASDEVELTEQDVKEAYRRIRIAERPLVQLLLERLKACDNVCVVESEKKSIAGRLPVVSFMHKKIPSADIVAYCRGRSIVCRQGTFLSTTALQQSFGFGDERVVRMSLVHYNTVAEVTQVMDTLESMVNW